MTCEIDFTNCPRVTGRAYNGANGKKIAVEFEGAVWLLKFPRIRSLDIGALVAEVPYLTDLQRRFYTAYLNARREKIFAGL